MKKLRKEMVCEIKLGLEIKLHEGKVLTPSQHIKTIPLIK